MILQVCFSLIFLVMKTRAYHGAAYQQSLVDPRSYGQYYGNPSAYSSLVPMAPPSQYAMTPLGLGLQLAPNFKYAHPVPSSMYPSASMYHPSAVAPPSHPLISSNYHLSGLSSYHHHPNSLAMHSPYTSAPQTAPYPPLVPIVPIMSYGKYAQYSHSPIFAIPPFHPYYGSLAASFSGGLAGYQGVGGYQGGGGYPAAGGYGGGYAGAAAAPSPVAESSIPYLSMQNPLHAQPNPVAIAPNYAQSGQSPVLVHVQLPLHQSHHQQQQVASQVPQTAVQSYTQPQTSSASSSSSQIQTYSPSSQLSTQTTKPTQSLTVQSKTSLLQPHLSPQIQYSSQPQYSQQSQSQIQPKSSSQVQTTYLQSQVPQQPYSYSRSLNQYQQQHLMPQASEIAQVSVQVPSAPIPSHSPPFQPMISYSDLANYGPHDYFSNVGSHPYPYYNADKKKKRR